MNHLCHSRTHVHNITFSPYTSFNSWKHSVGVFSIVQEISDRLCCSIFIPVTNLAEEHNMVTLKAQRQTNWCREMSPVLFDLRSFKVNCLSLAPHSYRFPW
jgi:hypothetical protein